MTNVNNGNNNNSQEIYAILAELTRRQLQTENNLQRTQEQIERTQEQIGRTQEQIERTQLQIDATQQQLSTTQYEVESLTNDVTRVLGRSAILDDVLLEMRNSNQAMQANFERHLQNFERHIENYEEHKRTTNAALNSLEAINLRLIQIITGDQN